MQVTSLSLRGFRNLRPQVVEPGPRFNVFAGQNGQGKTNLLEAVYVSCAVRSFRAQRLAELVQHDGDSATVAAEVRRDGLARTFEVAIQARGRQARVDGKAVRPLSKYFGGFNVVLFAPEDLQIPRGAPANRRKFLDRAVFGLFPGFLADVQKYEKSLKNRNAVLKAMQGGRTQDASLLDVYAEQMATHGARVILGRRRYLARLEPRLRSAFKTIMRIDEDASVQYDAPWPDTDEDGVRGALLDALVEGTRRDLSRGHTGVGPHRDDLSFTFGGRDAAAFASQGQLRAIVLAWKTAELELLAETLEEPPILLLDDVSSELDPDRNQYLFEFLRGRPNQCFITTTHPKYVLLDSDRHDYQVSAGEISTAIHSCG